MRSGENVLVSTLPLLRAALGADGPDLVRAVSTLDEQQLLTLTEAVRDTRWFESPTTGTTELWPLVSSRMSTFTAGGANDRFVDAPGAAGLNLWASLDPRFAGSGRFPNGVLRALLYCHGLIIEDPVAMAADMYLSTSPDARHLARMAVEAATSSMVEISELLDAEVVRTFSAGGDIDPIYQSLRRSVFEDQSVGVTEDEIWDAFEAGYVEGLDPRLQGLWERVRAGDREPSLDAIEAVAADGDVEVLRIFIDVLENLKPRGVVENALSVVAHAIGEAIRLGSSVDLLCPTPLFARLASAGATGMHDLRLHELARTDVPDLDGLLTSDAVAIRLRSEAFDTWRRDLSTALERAAHLRTQLGDDIDTTEVIRESIAGARSQLFGEAQRSAAMRAGFNSWIAFVAGLIGGAVGNSTGGAVGSAVGAAGAAVPPAIDSVTRRWRAPAPFLRRHYLVFEPDRGRRLPPS